MLLPGLLVGSAFGAGMYGYDDALDWDDGSSSDPGDASSGW